MRKAFTLQGGSQPLRYFIR
uniref:Uncharacterized protein n=1 Tax=Anguilla anguilla TaxID=7936 RepID=A0A0E9VEF0_ANGAN